MEAADTAGLLSLLTRLKAQAVRHHHMSVRIVSIYEAGLDGFWVHRLLDANGVESHVLDAASIAVDRRSRRAKTDRIDVEKLLRTLMGWVRGERQICSMVRPPSPHQEDERRQLDERRPGTFAFLGFTHYCGWTRDGRFHREAQDSE